MGSSSFAKESITSKLYFPRLHPFSEELSSVSGRGCPISPFYIVFTRCHQQLGTFSTELLFYKKKLSSTTIKMLGFENAGLHGTIILLKLKKNELSTAMLLGALNTIDCRSQLKKRGHKSPAIYPYIHGSVFTSCFREAQSSLLLF